jgi:hypothetical protein
VLQGGDGERTERQFHFRGEEGTGRLGGGLDTVAHGAGGGGGLGRLELEEERRDLGAGARPESRVGRALGRPISKKENW